MEFAVPHDHPCLPGHFPGRPIVPGVVVMDRVLDAIDAARAASGLAPLGALRLPQVKFVQPLLPGEFARVEVDPVPAADGGAEPARWRFRVLRGDVLLASGDVVAAVDAGPAG